jgi:hypothetical protein
MEAVETLPYPQEKSQVFIGGADPYQNVTPYDEKATARLLRKIDFYLIPFLALLYLYV